MAFLIKCSRQLVLKNRWSEVLRYETHPTDPNNDYLYVKRPDAAVVIPVFDDRILLVSQFRPPIGMATWELPSGAIAEGESPEQAARRELLEETSLAIAKLTKLGSFLEAPGYSTVKIYVYCADISAEIADISPAVSTEGEISESRWVPIKEVERMLQYETCDSATLASIALFRAFF